MSRDTGWLLRVVFLPFAAGYFLSYLFRTANAVLSGPLIAELGLDAQALGLLTSAYFLTFALAQLPLGVLLDRYGPRRVEAALLLVAALGAALFALADDAAELLVARALIGLGVSACLMGSFKAFVLWFPRERLPAINGWVLAAGGMGAISATLPLQALLGLIGWRGVFGVLAGLTLISALVLWWRVPERPEPSGPTAAAGDGLEAWSGLLTVFRSAHFWRIAPLATLSQASFLAIQGLWAGPWLRDVAGYDPARAAGVLLAVAVAMVAGFLSIGGIAYRLSRHGVAPATVAAVGMTAFMGVQLALLLGPVAAAWWLWPLFGYFGTAGSLCYSVLSQRFPAGLAGRVNTALNLLVFVVAFAAQWGMGWVIGHGSAGGGYPEQGYHWAFGGALALQLLALAAYGAQRGGGRP